MDKEMKPKSSIEKLRELIALYKSMQYITIFTWYVLVLGLAIFLIVSPEIRSLSRDLNSISEKVRKDAYLLKLILIVFPPIFIATSMTIKYCSYYTTTKVLKTISNLREELINDDANKEKVEKIDAILKKKILYQYWTLASIFSFKPLKDISK